MYKIKQFSELVGVSVRMLRHYDKIDLLIPENINRFNGYRHYGEKNLATMQQVLFFKELDFSLQEIKEMINDDEFQPLDALSMQRNLLNLKKQRLDNMLRFIDKLLDNETTGEIDMSKQLKKAMNKDDFNKQKFEYAKEIKNRWGNTTRFKQSQKRMAKYSKEDVAKINDKQEKIYQDLAKLMPQGIGHKLVQKLVHEAHMLINESWYECSKSQFASLGGMYVLDERFKANIDKHADGLAEFLIEAIMIYIQKS
jgi:DNA-binding transcriptional MerR regulator